MIFHQFWKNYKIKLYFHILNQFVTINNEPVVYSRLESIVVQATNIQIYIYNKAKSSDHLSSESLETNVNSLSLLSSSSFVLLQIRQLHASVQTKPYFAH